MEYLSAPLCHRLWHARRLSSLPCPPPDCNSCTNTHRHALPRKCPALMFAPASISFCATATWRSNDPASLCLTEEMLAFPRKPDTMNLLVSFCFLQGGCHGSLHRRDESGHSAWPMPAVYIRGVMPLRSWSAQLRLRWLEPSGQCLPHLQLLSPSLEGWFV